MKLNELINTIGKPQITEDKKDGCICVSDKNETWQKIQEHIVRKESEKIYMRELIKEAKKLEKYKCKLNDENLSKL